MIDITEHIEKLERLKVYMDKFIDNLAFQSKYYMRIITDVELSDEAKRRILSGVDNIEISSEKAIDHPRNGWGEPDRVIGDVELFYLWQQPWNKMEPFK